MASQRCSWTIRRSVCPIRRSVRSSKSSMVVDRTVDRFGVFRGRRSSASHLLDADVCKFKLPRSRCMSDSVGENVSESRSEWWADPAATTVSHVPTEWSVELEFPSELQNACVDLFHALTSWFGGTHRPLERCSTAEETAFPHHEQGETSEEASPGASATEVAVLTGAAAEKVQVGAMVRVQEDLMSNSEPAVLLQKGQVGFVETVDEQGDVGINFATCSEGQWVFFENLCKLKVIA